MSAVNRAYDRGREQGRAETEHRLQAEIERLQARGPDRFYEIEAWCSQLQADNERLRRWVYATARSLEDSGLSLEEYNAITAEVCRMKNKFTSEPE